MNQYTIKFPYILLRIVLLLLVILSFIATLQSAISQDDNANDDTIIRISSLKIKGEDQISKKEIENNIATKFPSIKPWVKRPVFDQEILKDDLARIKNLYANRGYYDANAYFVLDFNKDRSQVKITININEGKPVILKNLKLYYGKGLSDALKEKIKDSVPLEGNKIFSPIKYEETKSVISKILSNNGYPRSTIEGQALVNRRERFVDAQFHIDPGLLYSFGSVTVEGNEKVKSDIISREVTFQEGEPFSLDKIDQTQVRIFQLGLLRSVVIDSVYDDDNQIANIFIRVKERNLGTVKLGLGFGTEDKLRAQVIWSQRNFFGGGRRLETAGKVSFITQSLSTSLIQPYVVGQGSDLTETLNFQRDDVPSFEGESFFAKSTVNKLFGSDLSTYGSFTVQFSKVNRSTTRNPIDSSQENFFLTFFNLGFDLNKVDNLINPRNGYAVSFVLEPSFMALGSDVDYSKGSIEIRGYKDYLDIVFAKRVILGVIQPFGSTGTFDIPVFKRFFAGGSTSMRGFPFQELGPLNENNDPLGGNSIFIGNAEMRFPIYGEFGGVLFFDYGNVFERQWDFDLSNIKYAPGAGLRYDTLIGPVRLDVGYALNPEPGISRIQFFISIGQAF
ncbi:MAG: outer membrane protein assembly factor BamA [Thermodesulfobacteriota bacterium]